MEAIGLGSSDVGKKRDINEDQFLVDNDLGLYVVCDGMGGHAAGEVASGIAVDTVRRSVERRRPTINRIREGQEDAAVLVEIAREAVDETCREVYHQATSDPDRAGMGCTLTMLLVSGAKGVMGHVGDTRLYVFRDGATTQVSTDHTMAAELVAAGALDQENVKRSPYAHVLTRAVGPQPSVKAETLLLDVLPGDRYVLCSDGLSDYVDRPTRLAEYLSGELDAIPEDLVAFANTAGGHDNVTVVAVEVLAASGEERAALAVAGEVQVRFDILGAVFLFEDLTLAQLQRVLNICDVRTLAPGDLLAEEGDPCRTLYVVLEGRLSLTRAGNRLMEVAPGDAIGEGGLVRDRSCLASIAALQPSRVLGIDRDRFAELVRRRPWLGITLLQRLGRRLSGTADRIQASFEAVSGSELPRNSRPADLF